MARGGSKRPLAAARLGRKDWLDAALVMVARTGVPGLKVQDLAAALGATTGSLYWHFSSRRDLVEALLDHWGDTSTEVIARQIERCKGSPQKRLRELMLLVFSNEATSGDVAIRAFASYDARAAGVVARVDGRRAEVVQGLFRELGFQGDECAMRVQMLLCYESCERLVATSLSEGDRKRLLIARHRMYCRP